MMTKTMIAAGTAAAIVGGWAVLRADEQPEASVAPTTEGADVYIPEGDDDDWYEEAYEDDDEYQAAPAVRPAPAARTRES